MEALSLSTAQLQAMIAHVSALAPREACGLLAGRNARVAKVLRVTNQAQSETRYVMEPIEQLRAFEWIEANELELLGIYHSHPAGPSTPSPTDIAEARYPVVHVILSPAKGDWQARGFWIEDEKFEEVDLTAAE